MINKKGSPESRAIVAMLAKQSRIAKRELQDFIKHRDPVNTVGKLDSFKKDIDGFVLVRFTYIDCYEKAKKMLQ